MLHIGSNELQTNPSAIPDNPSANARASPYLWEQTSLEETDDGLADADGTREMGVTSGLSTPHRISACRRSMPAAASFTTSALPRGVLLPRFVAGPAAGQLLDAAA